MRKNVKKQLALRVLSTAALMAMVSSIATAAFAEEYDLTKGSVEIVAEEGSQYITQWDDKDSGTFVQDDKGEDIDHRPDPNITLTTKDETKPTSNTVTITAKEKGDTANVTLKDVHMEVNTTKAKSGAIEIKGDGNTNLELNGNNTVLVENDWFNHQHAAIEKADKNGKGTLTIKDDKNNDGSPKEEKDENGNAIGGDTGKLLAGGYHDSAAIGGSGVADLRDTSNIIITGGEITASGGGDGAGIGGGSGGDASNIRIEGNAHVTAYGAGGAAIGSGYQSTGSSDITITNNATVNAVSEYGCGIGHGQNAWGSESNATITISGHASVNAECENISAAIGSNDSSATVNIEENAAVTAVAPGVAIGTGYGHEGTSTVINITGGTVNAVTTSGNESNPAIGTVKGNLDLTINSSTGKTTVNAYTTSSDPLPLIGTANHYHSSTHKDDGISPSEGAEYNEDGSSHLGEDNAAIINSYCNTTLGTDTYDAPKTLDEYAFHATYKAYGDLYNAKHTLSDKDKGDLYKVVHNRKYMEEHPEIVDDFNKLENSDLHDWQLVDKVAPTLEKDGYADYICNIDKCCQTKRVVLPKLTPEEMREVGVIFWDAAAQAAPAALQGKVLSADEQTATAEKAQVESLLADKANWKLAEDVGDLMIHPAADAAGTVYEQAVKASGCQYYVIANVTAQ